MAPRKGTKKTGAQKIKYNSVGSTWDRKSSGTWSGGQSSSLNPGSEAAQARRVYRATGFKARTKKVIRPRLRKQQKG